MTNKKEQVSSMSSNVSSKSHSVVYCPTDAKTNIGLQPMETPKVEYEKRRWTVDRNSFEHKVEKRNNRS